MPRRASFATGLVVVGICIAFIGIFTKPLTGPAVFFIGVAVLACGGAIRPRAKKK